MSALQAVQTQQTQQTQQTRQPEKKSKDPSIDLGKYLGKKVRANPANLIRIKMQGGREVLGELRGFDQLVNVVLDECEEFLRDPNDPYKTTEETRKLGLVVCRGNQVSLICPADGMEEIENPFMTA